MSDIVVYGKGKTGLSLAKLLQKQGYRAIMYDDTGGFDSPFKFDSDTTVILSPGVKPTACGVVEAKIANSQIIGELEYCFRLCKGRCISVTGTNGKTTTCQMIYHILQKREITSYLLGNGGVPFSESVLNVDANDIVVLESSSFQLTECVSFAPFVSVFTNFATDHLDYHGSIEAYAKAKTNNFIKQKDGYAIFNLDDENVAQFLALSKCKNLTFSLSNPAANCYYGEKVALSVDGVHIEAYSEYFARLAKHNQRNALSAVLACYCVGVPLEFSLSALRDYAVLPHRLQSVAKIGKVEFVDDSKATNVHAVLSALDNFTENIALILGGSDKGEEFDAIFADRKPNLVKIVAVGETSQRIFACGRKYGVHIELHNDIKSAVYSCYKSLKANGGVVLMSNACASFDMFSGYAERGEYFQKVVGELYDSEQKN